MASPENFAHQHKDLVHDIDFDFYGRRFATCSSDQSVKVYDKTEDGSFKCSASWKTHSGSVWKVTWAHPDFGQVLATCSFDRTAAIWEEVNTVTDATISDKNQTHWVKRATLVDSRSSVTDVKFAPKHLGLLLASCSADGYIRVYEAPDVMNLSSWPLRDEFSCKFSCACLSWNTSRIRPPMIAVGSDDRNQTGTKVAIYEYSESGRKWFKSDINVVVTEPVYDMSFAPNIGRTFDILAVASRSLMVFSIHLDSSIGPTGLSNAMNGDNTPGQAHYQVVSTLDSMDHSNEKIWRVTWNITGTVLASSGVDGTVKIWRSNHLNTWTSIGNLVAEPPSN